MTRDEILAAILDEAGNPDTGVVRDIAGALADRLYADLNPAPAPAATDTARRSTRVVDVPESR